MKSIFKIKINFNNKVKIFNLIFVKFLQNISDILNIKNKFLNLKKLNYNLKIKTHQQKINIFIIQNLKLNDKNIKK